MESYQVPNETESFSFHSTMKVSASNDMRVNRAGRYKHEKHKDNDLFPHVNFSHQDHISWCRKYTFPFQNSFYNFYSSFHSRTKKKDRND